MFCVLWLNFWLNSRANSLRWTFRASFAGFKHENNECSRNGEKTKLHTIKIVVFWFIICDAMTGNSSRITPLWRNNDVIRDEMRVVIIRRKLILTKKKKQNIQLGRRRRSFHAVSPNSLTDLYIIYKNINSPGSMQLDFIYLIFLTQNILHDYQRWWVASHLHNLGEQRWRMELLHWRRAFWKWRWFVNRTWDQQRWHFYPWPGSR